MRHRDVESLEQFETIDAVDQMTGAYVGSYRWRMLNERQGLAVGDSKMAMRQVRL